MLCDFPDVAVHENTGQMPGDGFPGKIFVIYLRRAGHDFIWAYELHGHPEALAVLSDSCSGDAYSGGYCTKCAEESKSIMVYPDKTCIKNVKICTKRSNNIALQCKQ